MEYCSPFWAGAPASHLTQPDAVETKAFKFIGISIDEAESLGQSLSQCRQVSSLSIFYSLPSGLAPSALSILCPHAPLQVSAGCTWSPISPLQNSQHPESLLTSTHSFHFFFSCLWNQLPHSLQSRSSIHLFKTAVPHHLKSPPI